MPLLYSRIWVKHGSLIASILLRGDIMALFDRFRQRLTARKQIEFPAEKQDGNDQDASLDDGKRMEVGQSDRQARLAQLTPREKDVYFLLLEGFTLKESARQLEVKYSTANTHMTSIYRKLGVKSRAELIINYLNVDGENTPSP